jgi:hypothetical protein
MVAAVDLDADGNIDLVSASRAAAAVTRVLGNGDGTFGAASPVPVTEHTTGLAMGHLDTDDVVDLLVANTVGDTSTMFSGDGMGGFAPPTEIPTSPGQSSLAVLDINDDEEDDIVLTSWSDGLVALLADGTGGFVDVPAVDLTSGASSIHLDDVDGDGHVDAVLTGEAGGVELLLGEGDGTFVPAGFHQAFDGHGVVFQAASADINSDGRLDLISVVPYYYSVHAWLQGPTGLFCDAYDHYVGANPVSLLVTDLNGDGAVDFATVRSEWELGQRVGWLTILLATP